MWIDMLCGGVLAWVTVRVASEGAWGAVALGFCVFFAGLFAMNIFEPLADLLALRISASEDWQARWDVICFLGLFIAAVSGLRWVTERIAPARMPLHRAVEETLRWLAGLTTGWITVAVLLTAVHVAPLPRIVTANEVREPLGFEAERAQFFGTSPDRKWLAFHQWISLHALNRGDNGRLFDAPIYHSGGDNGRWPSFPIRYAARREKLTRARLGLDP